jgi:hypothetical protein
MDFISFFNSYSVINTNINNYKDALECLNDNPGIDLISYIKEIKINSDTDILLDYNEIDIANNFKIDNQDLLKVNVELLVNDELIQFNNRLLIPMCCKKTPLIIKIKFNEEPFEINLSFDIYLAQIRIKNKLMEMSLNANNINYYNDIAKII